jgi:hypothetical protein
MFNLGYMYEQGLGLEKVSYWWHLLLILGAIYCGCTCIGLSPCKTLLWHGSWNKCRSNGTSESCHFEDEYFDALQHLWGLSTHCTKIVLMHTSSGVLYSSKYCQIWNILFQLDPVLPAFMCDH